MLENKVEPVIRGKGHGLKRIGVLFLQGNAYPYTVKAKLQTTEKLGWHVLPHPAYTSDLVLSDFFLFSPLKELLHLSLIHI